MMTKMRTRERRHQGSRPPTISAPLLLAVVLALQVVQAADRLQYFVTYDFDINKKFGGEGTLAYRGWMQELRYTVEVLIVDEFGNDVVFYAPGESQGQGRRGPPPTRHRRTLALLDEEEEEEELMEDLPAPITQDNENSSPVASSKVLSSILDDADNEDASAALQQRESRQSHRRLSSCPSGKCTNTWSPKKCARLGCSGSNRRRLLRQRQLQQGDRFPRGRVEKVRGKAQQRVKEIGRRYNDESMDIKIVEGWQELE